MNVIVLVSGMKDWVNSSLSFRYLVSLFFYLNNKTSKVYPSNSSALYLAVAGMEFFRIEGSLGEKGAYKLFFDSIGELKEILGTILRRQILLQALIYGSLL